VTEANVWTWSKNKQVPHISHKQPLQVSMLKEAGGNN